MTTPKAEAGWSTNAKRWWKSTHADYELTASEIVIAREVARQVTRLDTLNTALDSEPLTTENRFGERVASPLLVEARQISGSLAKLISTLRLPEIAVDDQGRTKAGKDAAETNRRSGNVREPHLRARHARGCQLGTMAAVRERQVSAQEQGILPWPLTLGPSVEHFAPEDYQRHPTPPRDQDERVVIMLTAKRNYGTYFGYWAADQGVDWETAKRHKVNRRPYWP